MPLARRRVRPAVNFLRSTSTLENPATGERFEFREDTDVLRFDYYLEPGGFAVGRIDHAHPSQEERFEVRSGELDVRIDGDEWTATPGTRFAIPPGTSHTVRNGGEDEMHALVEIDPTLDTKAFFETMSRLARDGETIRWGLPGPVQLAVVAHAYREELYFPVIPVAVQRAVAAGLAPFGRAIGRRARYPEDGEST